MKYLNSELFIREIVLKHKSCIKNTVRVSVHTKSSNTKKLYSSSVLLPQTKLPLRLENKKLVERDQLINNISNFQEFYSWQRQTLKGPEFVLHDGPPYANGELHMGHAINKILKDTIIRYKILEGRKVHYVPGWDCHGLPIELKVISNAKNTYTPMQIRSKAKKFAESTIEKQKNAFKSWGIIGDWDNAYMTYNSLYIKNQIMQFYILYKKKLIFRDLKPVYWSPSSRTALAEAELEYKTNHKSLSAIIKLKIKHLPEQLFSFGPSNVHALIWTTTPWTLPGNQAVCYNPELSYSFSKKDGSTDVYLTATNLVESLSKTLGYELHIVNSFPGKCLHETTYYHPLESDNILPFLPGEHALDNKGTGLVHTAPGHGPDDFLMALKYKLPLRCLVDESGSYTTEAGPELVNLSVLSEGTNMVLNLIKDAVLHTHDYIHSYPYDWRTKQPVILRASEQWFIDTDALKNRAIELAENLEIIPKLNSEIYKRNLIDQIRKRPYWCISRQRSWGVPIPVFYNKSTGIPIINNEIIDHYCKLIDKYGPDFWWNSDLEKLLVPQSVLEKLGLTFDEIIQGRDIFDIWFDSGLSWLNVLEGEKVADLYLEGVDQFTGWFQSSLMTSVALRDKAPYKVIYVHGFAVDENGLKMSKSLGNVVNPQEIIMGSKGNKPYGIDTLRWWVVCHANKDSIAHVSKNVLQASADEVQKIRSVLRFALGALYDYQSEIPDYSSLLFIDKYLLHLLWMFQKETREYSENYLFHKIAMASVNLLTNSVSSVYYMAIKDRLYCELPENLNRKAAQFVLLQIFTVVTRAVAPIIPHLAEELYMYLPLKKKGTYFFNSPVPVPNTWHNETICQLVEDIVLNIKKDINKAIGSSSLHLHVHIKTTKTIYDEFMGSQSDVNILCSEIANVLQVADVTLEESVLSGNSKYLISLKESHLFMCDRCRRTSSTIKHELCERCKSVFENNSKKAFVAS